MEPNNIINWKSFLQGKLQYSCSEPVEIYSLFVALRAGGLTAGQNKEAVESMVAAINQFKRIYIKYSSLDKRLFWSDVNRGTAISFTKEAYKEIIDFVKSKKTTVVLHHMAGQPDMEAIHQMMRGNHLNLNLDINKNEREETKMNEVLRNYYGMAQEVLIKERENKINEAKSSDTKIKLFEEINSWIKDRIDSFNINNASPASLADISICMPKVSDKTQMKIDEIKSEYYRLLDSFERFIMTVDVRLQMCPNSLYQEQVLKDFNIIKSNNAINLDYSFIKSMAERGVPTLETEDRCEKACEDCTCEGK